MTRHIIWQTALALLGIALTFIILFQLPPDVVPEVTVEVPADGGTYVEGILGFSDTINPILAPLMVPGNPVNQDLGALVFDGLTAVDKMGQIVPSLALEWDVSEDGTTYDFHLRQDVVWHDGAPLTAADVAFTIQAMQDPGYQGDANLQDLWLNVTVYQVDDYTVRFTLEEPFPSFLYYTSIGLLPAHLLGSVPASELPSHPFSKERPVGTGRFMVETVLPDQVVLVANPSYWGPKPMLDKVAFWFYGDWEGLLEDYGQGIVHGFHPPRLEYLPTLIGMPSLELYSAQSAGYGTIYLNLTRESLPFFQEKEVRQALLYALDRQALIDESLGGQAVIADSPILPMSWAHDPSVRQYRYDPERAIGLLDASGWQDTDADFVRDKDDIELAFTLLTSDDPNMVRMAEQLASQWQAVGVDTTIRSVSNEAQTTFVLNRNFDAALVEIVLSADPDPYPLWHSTQAESGQNFSGFASEEADMILEAGRLTADVEERAEQYRAFQHLFAEEVPSLLLYYPIYTYAVDAQVRQVQLSPLFHTSDRFRNVDQWYTETEEIVVSGDEGIVVSEDEELDKTEE